jgi:TonB family protein
LIRTVHAFKQRPAADGVRPARRAGDGALVLAVAASLLLHGLLLLAAQRANPLPAPSAAPPSFAVFELAPAPAPAPAPAGSVSQIARPARASQLADAQAAGTPPDAVSEETAEPSTRDGAAGATAPPAGPPHEAAATTKAPAPAAAPTPPEPAPAPSPAPARVAGATHKPAPARKPAVERRAEPKPTTPAAKLAAPRSPAPLPAPSATLRQAGAQRPAAAAAARSEKPSGLAALDAEIAATRRRAEQPPRPLSAPADGRNDRSGLAALDAEIAASRRAERQSTTPAPAGKPARGTDARPAAPPRPQAASPTAHGHAERSYLAALRNALERQRHYPATARQRRLEGTARVQFTIAANGAFSGIRVSQSTGVAALDDAALHTVRRLGRFEPIPAVLGRSQWTVRVPIVFRLN